MKICYLYSNYYLAHLTGQAGLMDKLAQKASQNLIEVSVISNDFKDYSFTKNGIKYFLHKGKGDYFTYIINFISIIYRIYQLKPDILHVHGVLFTIYIWCINLLLGIPLCITLTETLDQFNSFTLKILSFCLNKSNHIFVTSNYLKVQLINIGVNEKIVTLIRMGLNEKFILSKVKYERDYLLYFGDANIERGFDRLFLLAKKLPEMKFLILLRFFDASNTLVKSMQKLSNVTIRYYPYKQTLITLLQQAKLIILPFRWMSIRPPISLLEAMALGKCVLTSTMCGNEEIITNGRNGYMYDFNQIDSVVRQVKLLTNTNKYRQAIGKKAKENIKKLYSINEYTKIFKLYQSI